jgi:hypothetical protein
MRNGLSYGKPINYLDLTSDQCRDLSQRLAPLLARHRQEAIPQYVTVLMQSRQRLERGLTKQDIDWVYANYDRLRADLRTLPQNISEMRSIEEVFLEP